VIIAKLAPGMSIHLFVAYSKQAWQVANTGDTQVTSERAFQDHFEQNLCFGCGATNPDGLHLKSRWKGDEAVATFQPRPYHMAGPTHVLNGGIIGTIIDCHCVCTAIADAYRREGRAIGTGAYIWYATVSLKIDYLRPTPIHGSVELVARIKLAKEKKTVVECSAVSGGKECARAEVVAVRVPEEWLAST
jgi:acyl-coenzyme A thioesterase PaaI-like protein